MDPAPVGLTQAAAIWIADKRDAIDDPDFRAIYIDYDAAFDWSPDDPRLPALADRTPRWLANRRHTSEHAAPPIPDPIIAQLVAASAAVASPAWDRLTEIAQQDRARWNTDTQMRADYKKHRPMVERTIAWLTRVAGHAVCTRRRQ